MPVQSRLWQLVSPADADWRRVAAVGGLSLAALATLWWVKNRLTNELPPGPFAWPLLGSLSVLSATGDRACIDLPDELYLKYGPVVTVMAGPLPMVCVLEPKAVQEALSSRCFSNRGLQTFSFATLSEGFNNIFVSPADERWRFHRKLAHSAFRQFAQGEQLERLTLNAFDSATRNFAGDGPQDLFDKVYFITYNLQSVMSLGKEFEFDSDDYKRLRSSALELNAALTEGLPADTLPGLQYLPLASTRKFNEVTRYLIQWFERKVGERKRRFNANELNDILDFLISEQRNAEASGSGHFFQDVHLRQTLLDIFIAGTDTTSSTMYYCIRALCQHPEMQKRCYEEICSVFGADGTPSCSERHRLPYTDAFLHEVLRYWMLTTMIAREASEDTTLCGYRIRKGTMMLLSVVRCHLDESVFPNARQFDPGHFLQSDGSLSPYQRGFLPFGAGTRVCLGESIAKKTTFLLLVLLVQRFSFSWDGGDGSRGFADNSSFIAMLPKRFKVTVKERRSV